MRLAAIAFCLLVAAPAQERVRQTRFASLKLLDAGSESLRIPPNDSPRPSTCEWTTFYPSKVTVTRALPFHRAGSLNRLNDDLFLACGRTSDGEGVLATVRLVRSPRAIEIGQSATFAEFDLYAAAWNGSHLVVLDFTGQRLLVAPWNAADAFPAAADFREIANERDLPVLGNPSYLELSPATGTVFLSYGHRRVARIVRDGDAWRVVTRGLYDEWRPEPHRVAGTSAASGPFTPLVRYGKPTTAAGLGARFGLLDADQAFVGSVGFPGMFVRTSDPVPAPDERLRAELWVHVRAVDGSDPVQVDGERALLEAPLFAREFDVAADAAENTSGVKCPLPIPNDPALAGAVLLCQLAVQRGDEVVVSDVFGTTLRDAPDDADRRPTWRGARAWTSRSEAERAAIHTAVVHWLGSLSAAPRPRARLYEVLLRDG